MATSLGALCTDFYINQKLSLKMDLPAERETLLHFFDRVRKSVPSMGRFRRYEDELALESPRREDPYRWLSLRQTSLRAGLANPQTMASGYGYHRHLLELSPPFLSLSPLDVDFLEVLFGFDLECERDHDAVIHEALIEDTSLARAVDLPNAKPLDIQPRFGLQLEKDLQAYFEVKTRTRSRRGSAKAHQHEPIGLFLTVRRYGPIDQLEDLPGLFNELAGQAEQLATERLVPHILTPIARCITSGTA